MSKSPNPIDKKTQTLIKKLHPSIKYSVWYKNAYRKICDIQYIICIMVYITNTISRSN